MYSSYIDCLPGRSIILVFNQQASKYNIKSIKNNSKATKQIHILLRFGRTVARKSSLEISRTYPPLCRPSPYYPRTHPTN